ncbi:MAG: DUF5357 family protein [Leptolyngbyaceae cyanobacterium]
MLGFFNALQGFFRDLQKLLWPATWDSWKTLLWMCIYSWLMALLTNQTNWVHQLIASCGWVFLIAGLHWAMHDQPFKDSLTLNKMFIGPWITGALICYFLFGGVDAYAAPGLIFWPPLSALIDAIPKFIGGTNDGPVYKQPKPGVMQDVVILCLINFLISCWFAFHFLIQAWLTAYPDIRSQDLNRSPFVVVISDNNRPTTRGVLILDQAAALLQADLNGRPWSEVERWLLPTELPANIDTLEQQVLNRIATAEENTLWQLNGRVLPPAEYDLQLQAIWTGPSQQFGGYFLTKTCQIRKVTTGTSQWVTQPIYTSGNQVSPSTTAVATVNCGPAIGPTPVQPNALINQASGANSDTPLSTPPQTQFSPAPGETPAKKW